ncbi:Helix-turn-helix [Serratia fonticola]|uniref:Helix-turn-helix n=1 Tax=Serratia fonticola TaxID=47917 RepID=A0A4U9WI71_SERFO|nr:Helix-turn-helix [Serratia fonticola]
MQDLASHLAQTLKSLRTQRGWSLNQAAENTGVSKAMLGQIERGGVQPNGGDLMENCYRV